MYKVVLQHEVSHILVKD